MRKALLGIIVVVALLAIVLLFNTFRHGSRQMAVQPLAALAVDQDRAAQSLAGAVRAKTISGLLDPAGTALEFDKLHEHLRTRYPLVHAQLKREVIGGHSLLYTWSGSDPAARPVGWMAHQDVVPIAPGTQQLWKQPPFEGRIENGVVWGRGAWDNKGNLIAQLEAVETALAAGFKPKRTLYLVFGHDEEVGGRAGAGAVAEVLRQRGVKLDYLIDEGLVVTEGILKGVEAPIALIGVAEKGFMTIKLGVDATPGHSSMPPAAGTSAIAILSAALVKLDAHQIQGGIRGLTGDMFATVAPEMAFGQRLALSNLWLTGPLVEGMLSKSPSTDAMMRTTTALTVINAGNKDNVLPGRAEAIVNFRLLPGDTVDSVLAHVKSTIADSRVSVDKTGQDALEASKVSSYESPAFRHIEQAVREVFPGAVVAPGLMLGGTDTRHFGDITDNAYRFTPIRADSERLKLFHGTNERVEIVNLVEMIRFYHRLLQLTTS